MTAEHYCSGIPNSTYLHSVSQSSEIRRLHQFNLPKETDTLLNMTLRPYRFVPIRQLYINDDIANLGFTALTNFLVTSALHLHATPAPL